MHAILDSKAGDYIDFTVQDLGGTPKSFMPLFNGFLLPLWRNKDENSIK